MTTQLERPPSAGRAWNGATADLFPASWTELHTAQSKLTDVQRRYDEESKRLNELITRLPKDQEKDSKAFREHADDSRKAETANLAEQEKVRWRMNQMTVAIREAQYRLDQVTAARAGEYAHTLQAELDSLGQEYKATLEAARQAHKAFVTKRMLFRWLSHYPEYKLNADNRVIGLPNRNDEPYDFDTVINALMSNITE